MKNLANQFLISMPHINDRVFKKTLIYICSHDNDGAMGLIINKSISEFQSEKDAKLILNQTKLSKIITASNVCFGGPVDLNMGMILHPLDYFTNKTIKISKKIGVTSDLKILNDIKLGKGPSTFRFSVGYAGWSNGQLNEEFKNGDWLLLPSQSEIIFSMPNSQKWDYINKKIGVDLSDISGNTGFA